MNLRLVQPMETLFTFSMTLHQCFHSRYLVRKNKRAEMTRQSLYFCRRVPHPIVFSVIRCIAVALLQCMLPTASSWSSSLLEASCSRHRQRIPEDYVWSLPCFVCVVRHFCGTSPVVDLSKYPPFASLELRWQSLGSDTYWSHWQWRDCWGKSPWYRKLPSPTLDVPRLS